MEYISDVKEGIITLYDSLFGVYFYIQHGTSNDKHIKDVKEITGLEIENLNSNGMCTHLNYDRMDIIWISTTKKDIPTLVHECLHAANYAIMSRDMNFNEKTEELFCYYVKDLIWHIINYNKDLPNHVKQVLY